MGPRLNISFPGPVAAHGATGPNDVAFSHIRVVPARQVLPDTVGETVAVLKPVVDEGRPVSPVTTPASPAMAHPIIEVDPAPPGPAVKPVVVIATTVRVAIEAVGPARQIPALDVAVEVAALRVVDERLGSPETGIEIQTEVGAPAQEAVRPTPVVHPAVRAINEVAPTGPMAGRQATAAPPEGGPIRPKARQEAAHVAVGEAHEALPQVLVEVPIHVAEGAA